ncbi:M48 family metalloprotease [Massilia sp. CCM 8734]|uniref:M48 family metallopeptidase n=1 Tax=Massilia sp. CCM 8734 TaxID=2609283 RepID=UPI001420539A|nr:M48 family metalloprotease [Massilia sp. CCM 8734]NHZ99041.1 M48 family metalloprotease [Massilia sp. CCM 8734]
MELLPSRITRYLLLFVSLLAIVELIESLAKAVAGYGGFGFAVTLWACFGAAYGWLLVEPMIRPLLLMRRTVRGSSERRVRRIGAGIARDSGTANPKFYVYESEKFDVMVSGIGRGVTILVSGAAADVDDQQLRSILAHEFGHIRLRHSLIRLTMYGSLLSLAIVGHSMTAIVLPANLFVLWTMRQMEFAADRDAARVVGRNDVRTALERVGGVLGDIPQWQAVFSTHPTFRDRIARLS